MAHIVYILCTILSFSCFILLIKAYKKSKLRLLFWCSIGFFGFGLNNALLFVDLIIGPSMDLSIVRTLPALAGMILLVYGLVMEDM